MSKSLNAIGLFLIINTSCADTLWHPYIENTDANCNLAGCGQGTRCNTETGFCESFIIDKPIDCSTGPACFDAGRVILSDPATPIYNVAAADLLSDSSLDLALSGDSTKLCILAGDNKFQGTAISSCATMTATVRVFDVGQQMVFLHGFQNPASGARDLIVAPLGSNIYQYNKAMISGGLPPNMLTTFSNFKVLLFGDLDGDNLEDMVVTNSQLPLATQYFPKGGGNMQLFLGQAAGTFTPSTTTPMFTTLSIAAQAPKLVTSPFNMAMTNPKANTSDLYTYKKNGTTETLDLAATVSFSADIYDFALPVDLDNDGDLDLILAKTMEVNGTGLPSRVGSLKIAYNTGATPLKFTNPVAIVGGEDTSDLFGIQIDDVDQDGYPDVIAALFLQQSIVIYKNTVTGFAKSYAARSNTYFSRDATVIDIDGDGCKDLVSLFNGKIDTGGMFSTAGSELILSRGHYNAKVSRTAPACP